LLHFRTPRVSGKEQVHRGRGHALQKDLAIVGYLSEAWDFAFLGAGRSGGHGVLVSVLST
jgi:hypothetical protein